MTLIDTRTPNPKSFIAGSTGDWEIIIGMEVHAQVTSESKLFSGSSTEFGNPPNSNVSFVDAAMPGMLPTINEECVRQAVRTGLVDVNSEPSRIGGQGGQNANVSSAGENTLCDEPV